MIFGKAFMIHIPKPRMFKGVKKTAKKTVSNPIGISGLAHTTATSTDSEVPNCDPSVKHPSVMNDLEHHFHISPIGNDYQKICCRCGFILDTGKYISKTELKKFNEKYW